MTLTGLAARNILRNRFRATLTIIAIAIGCIAFVLLRTTVLSWTSYGSSRSHELVASRVWTRNKTTITMPIPIRYADEIRAMPHVKAATWETWFGGHDPNHETEFFVSFAVDTKSFFATFVNDHVIPDDQRRAWLDDRQGIMVGDVIAQKLGWKVGDRVRLESGLFPAKPGEPWSFNVRAIYKPRTTAIDRTTMYFHHEYLNDNLPERRRDATHAVIALVDASTAELSKAIDQHFDEKDFQTFSQDERTFRTSFLASASTIFGALNIMTLTIMLIMMLILGNTIAMGVRERTNEYGALRAVGFLPRHVTFFIVGEAMFTGLVGGALGTALGFPMVQCGIGPNIVANMGSLFPTFDVEPLTIVVALLAAILLGGFAALIPAVRASRLSIVEALRRVE